MGLIDVLKNLLGKRPRPEETKSGMEDVTKTVVQDAQAEPVDEAASGDSDETAAVPETETSPEPQTDPAPETEQEPAEDPGPEPASGTAPEPSQEPVQMDTPKNELENGTVEEPCSISDTSKTAKLAADSTAETVKNVESEPASDQKPVSSVSFEGNPICNEFEVNVTDLRTVATPDMDLAVNGIKLSIRPSGDKPAIERFSGEVITWNGGQYASDWIVYSKDFYKNTKINPSRAGFRSTTLLNDYTLFLKRDGKMLSNRQIEVAGLLAKAVEENLVTPAEASDFCLVSQGNSIQCFISVPKTSITDENIRNFAWQAMLLKIKPRKKKKK